VVHRAPGFDVPEFLAAGPREVLVAASGVPAARDVLREVDPGESADRPRRALAWLLIPMALIGLAVCIAADVLP
jgi:hypothetical protein